MAMPVVGQRWGRGILGVAGMAGMACSILLRCARLWMVTMVGSGSQVTWGTVVGQRWGRGILVVAGMAGMAWSGYRLACGGSPLLPRRVELQLHLRAR